MEPGILKVTEKQIQEIEAHSVRLTLVVEGENVIYGNAALEKSEEIKYLIEKMKPLQEAVAISVKSISIKSDTGWFSKSSKGVYVLEVMVKDLHKLNAVLGIIMDAKNIDMSSIEWIFDEESAKTEAIKKAVLKAKNKADAMMSVISYRASGIRSCSDSYEIPDTKAIKRHDYFEEKNRTVRCLNTSSSSSASMDLGIEIRGKKEITAITAIEFFIEPLPATV